ncbi:hypothetical protein ACSG7X_000404 [Vibrio fluvialis]
MRYAVLSLTDPNEKLEKLIKKACSILGDRATVVTTTDSRMNMLFYVNSKGNKELYSEDPIPDCGYPIAVNPKFGNLRAVAMQRVKGFLKLSPRQKSLVYATLACLFGLEGKQGQAYERLTVRFVVTYLDKSDPRYEENEYAALLAKSLGFKIIDLADKTGREVFLGILRRLSAK